MLQPKPSWERSTKKALARKKNLRKSLHWYQQAVRNNFAPACHALGIYYLRGIFVPREEQQDYDQKAYELFQQAVKLDHWDACMEVGFCYFYGRGVEKNEEFAKQWASPRPSKRTHYTAFRTGYFQQQGIIFEKDLSAGFSMIRMTIGKDPSTQSLVYFALCNLHGIGVPQKTKRAIKALTNAVNKGDAQAAYQLARIYHRGLVTETDTKLAAKHYRLAAESGDEIAQLGLLELAYPDSILASLSQHAQQAWQRFSPADRIPKP